MRILRYSLALLIALTAAPAYAHFLWINTVKDTSGETTVQLCFGEEGEPGEANLVDRLAKVPLLANKAGEKPAAVKTEKQVTGETAFFGAKGDSEGVAWTSALDHGVSSRGANTYLLQYWAKHLDAAKPETLKTLARAENLRLDVVPTIDKDDVEVVVLFDGKPVAAGSQVLVEIPNVGRDEHTTDAKGKVKFKLAGGGHYELRAKYKNEVAGERDGKQYPYEMHYSTLVMNVPGAEKTEK